MTTDGAGLGDKVAAKITRGDGTEEVFDPDDLLGDPSFHDPDDEEQNAARLAQQLPPAPDRPAAKADASEWQEFAVAHGYDADAAKDRSAKDLRTWFDATPEGHEVTMLLEYAADINKKRGVELYNIEAMGEMSVRDLRTVLGVDQGLQPRE
jgi:hypothetical protein